MPFLKLYSREWLHGSLRVQNDAAERGVWADFLALANESRNRGVIQANDETPYPHSYLASVLNIPPELLERCIQKFTDQKRIAENQHGILIINFAYWQGLDTRRRGRPSKLRHERPEPTDELERESEELERGELERESEAQEIWKAVLGELQLQVNKSNYRTWLAKTTGLGYHKDRFVIGVPTNFVAEYLDANQRSLIEKVLSGITHQEVNIQFQVDPNLPEERG